MGTLNVGTLASEDAFFFLFPGTRVGTGLYILAREVYGDTETWSGEEEGSGYTYLLLWIFFYKYTMPLG